MERARCDLLVTRVRVGSRYAFQKSELIDQISPFENKVTVFFFFKIFLNSNTADLNLYK